MGGVGDDNSFYFQRKFVAATDLFLDKVAFIARNCLPRKQVEIQQIIMFLDRNA